MLEVKNIGKRLGSTWALDDLSFTVARGERLVVCGPNGVGKSTLLQVLAGVLQPDRGALFWDEKPLHGRQGKGQQIVGYVPEAADPPGHLCVGELLEFVAAVKACATPSEELLAPLQVQELLGERISELSLGQRRRACLAASLVGEPAILLLDEPTNGLDSDATKALASMLATPDDNRVLICATHDMDFAAAVETRRLNMGSRS